MKFPKKTFLLVFIASVAFVFFIATNGTFVLKKASHHPFLFESMWDWFRWGRVDLPKYAGSWESFKIDGRYYVYYGFFPAILRAFFLSILDNSWYGKLTILSCCLSAPFISAFTFLIVYEGIRYQNFKHRFSGIALLSLLSFSLVAASPVIYAAVRPEIYGELVLWGYAFNLLGVYGFIKFMDNHDSNLAILCLSIAASLAFITRVTFGGPLYILIAIALFVLIHQRKLTLKKMWIFSICIWGMNFQLWYNYVRFGNIFTFVPTETGPFYSDVLNHSGITNIFRAKENFYNYFFSSTHDGSFRPEFPYFFTIHHNWFDEGVFMPYFCFIIPFSRTMPYFMLFPLAALYIFINNLILKNKRLILRMLSFMPPLIIESLIILSFNACFERYKVEFMPLMLACVFFSLRELRSRLFTVTVYVLCIYSCVATFLHTISLRPVAM